MWATIQEVILGRILALLNLADVASASAVCSHWRWIVRRFATGGRLSVRHRPWLVLSARPRPQASALLNPLCRPGPDCTRGFCGAHGDWIAVSDDSDQAGLFLLHPLLGDRIPLPPLKSLPPPTLVANRMDPSLREISHSVHKVVLSSPPAIECRVAVILAGGKLAYCTLGANTWTEFETDNWREEEYYEDAIFSGGQLLALDNLGSVWALEFRRGRAERRALMRAGPRQPVSVFHSRYLMESMGQIIMAVRLREEEFLEQDRPSRSRRCGWRQIRGLRTVDFRVFRLDSEAKEWVKMDSLGDRTMFVGRGLSELVAAEEIREEFGVDCIYFAEFELMEPADTGVFWMANWKLKRVTVGVGDEFFWMANWKLKRVTVGVGDDSELVAGWGGRVPLFFSLYNYRIMI